jgi:type I restriction enzyme S subunit
MREGYKESLLGLVPENWEIRRINDFVTEVKGGAALKPSDFVNKNGFPVIPKKSIVKGGQLSIDKSNPTFCSKQFADNNKNNIIDKDYIVTTLRDLVPSGPSIGYMVQFQSKDKFILAQGVYGFKINNDISREFLIQYSNTLQFRKVMQKIKVGSTQVHIRNKDYFGVSIPLPPLPEQQKIAEILSTVDAKIEIIDQQISETSVLKKGVMQRLLTKGIGHTKFKNSVLGEIPESWEVVKVSEISDVIDSLHKTPFFSDRGYPMVRVGDINKPSLNLDKCLMVSKDVYLDFNKNHKPKRGDILMTRVGSFGKTILVETDSGFCIGQNTVVITGIETPKFLNFTFNSFLIQKQLKLLTNGSSQPSLSLKNIRNLSVLSPPIQEQIKISNVLNSIDDKLQVLSEKKVTYQELKQGLMQQLLTGKVRVKV